MSSTFTPPGDGWVEGVPAGNLGPIEILTIGTVTSPDAVPAVRRYFRRLPALPPLPARPGYYVAERPAYGDTVVVELLGSPAGQWVDAGDRNYLAEGLIRALGPLRRLIALEDVIGYFRREAGPEADRHDWRVRAADTIAAEWDIDR